MQACTQYTRAVSLTIACRRETQDPNRKKTIALRTRKYKFTSVQMVESPQMMRMLPNAA